ncbi:uncharacterized protein LOC124149694 [Haliotis rufescens]|uniref:uncharacterized protein LOC124149694 n=1 Tax=Haliotis rufescens TaxID=6454 RepID=UPI00201EB698|nr:uncharacterized protein LOC124149694 [Haliotis rufescens]
MMQSINRTTFIIIVSLAQTALSTPQLSCPDISYPGVFARLTCYTTTHYSILQYSGPDGIIAPQCVANWSSCTNVEGYNASIINTTHTELGILSINPTHTGLWTCAAPGDDGNSSCELHVKMTADKDASISTSITTVAIVAGSVAVAIIVVLVIFLVRMKQSKRTEQPEKHSDENVYDSPYDVVGQTDETSGHENNTLYLTPVQGDKSFCDVISS